MLFILDDYLRRISNALLAHTAQRVVFCALVSNVKQMRVIDVPYWSCLERIACERAAPPNGLAVKVNAVFYPVLQVHNERNGAGVILRRLVSASMRASARNIGLHHCSRASRAAAMGPASTLD